MRDPEVIKAEIEALKAILLNTQNVDYDLISARISDLMIELEEAQKEE